MKHGSLFSEIGGFDLAAEWMGWENKFHCEWNKFGQKVLHYYWPEAKQYTDITKSDFMEWRGKIDIITGGFPCQPYSSAGKRIGKEDERHLWPEMLRVIREVQPRWIVGENVLGLTNWSGGVVFEEVQTDLEAAGYEVQAYVLPAAAVNAPHRRDRVWFVAYSDKHTKRSSGTSSSVERCWSRNNDEQSEWRSKTKQHFRFTNVSRTASHTYSNGQHSSDSEHEINASEGGQYAQRDIEQSDVDGDAADTLCNRIDKRWYRGQTEFFNKDGFERGIITDTTNIGQKYAMENGELEGGRFRQSYKRNAWDSFPSVSPVHSRNDGISNQLDGITFSK